MPGRGFTANSQPVNSREREIFLDALEIVGPGERQSFLERACAGEPGLGERIRALLEAHEEAGSFLPDADLPSGEPRLDGSEGAAPRVEGPGALVGRYKLVEKIGEGGFGVVYMAEQREPVKRRVALKIIKLGMDTKEVVARFEAERQALAMMEHPNIARVLDAGTTDQGRPYFVMEFVRGVPITQFCDESNLSTAERLRLFGQVCQAIQHAHQKGIVHRDIKPSNVLITLHDDHAVPKVIDFGIAKAIGHELTDKTIFTRFHEFLGTPAYMSPEQTQPGGLDIDTRSDIYSLGVLLYELLTGHTPFNASELLSAGYDEIHRRIREDEPLKPSTRLNTLAAEDRLRIARHRRSDPHQLRRALKGDLDWIVMKAMEKDRARRYESASAFAHDLEHYLDDEPVTAVAPSLGYRVHKFARRHRTALGVASALTVVLVIAALVSVWLAVRATHAERIARSLLETEQSSRKRLERMLVDLKHARQSAEHEAARSRAEAATAEAVARFVGEDLFGAADPENEPDRNLTLREVLDRASRRLRSSSALQPLIAASLHNTIGRAYRNLGLYGDGIEHLRRAYELHLGTSGERHEGTLRAMILYAHALHAGGQRHEGTRLLLKARDLVREVLGPRHPLNIKCMAQLAWMRYRHGEGAEAFRLAEQAYASAQATPGVEERDLVAAMHLVARARGATGTGRFEDGEALFNELVQLSRERHGDDHVQTLHAKHHLAGFLYDSRRRLDDAERLYLEVLEVQRRVLGEDHDHTLIVREGLALLYEVQQRPREALRQYLALLQFRPFHLRALQLMPELLERAPLGVIVADNDAMGWRVTTNAPAANWAAPEFDSSRWSQTLHTYATNAWFRHELDLCTAPEQPWVFKIHAWGNFEVFLNGVPAVIRFGVAGKEFQLGVADLMATRALRPGRNVIALRATQLRPTHPVSILVYHPPQAENAPGSGPHRGALAQRLP
jgi:eukaryotic-like serine/threonine-protein kinase